MNSELSQQLKTLTDATECLYWTIKYVHLGAMTNKDENQCVFGALESMADQINIMAIEIKNTIDNNM